MSSHHSHVLYVHKTWTSIPHYFASGLTQWITWIQPEMKLLIVGVRLWLPCGPLQDKHFATRIGSMDIISELLRTICGWNLSLQYEQKYKCTAMWNWTNSMSFCNRSRHVMPRFQLKRMVGKAGGWLQRDVVNSSLWSLAVWSRVHTLGDLSLGASESLTDDSTDGSRCSMLCLHCLQRLPIPSSPPCQHNSTAGPVTSP